MYMVNYLKLGKVKLKTIGKSTDNNNHGTNCSNKNSRVENKYPTMTSNGEEVRLNGNKKLTNTLNSHHMNNENNNNNNHHNNNNNVSFLNNFTNNFNSIMAKKKFGQHKFFMDVNHEKRPRLVKKCGELNIDMESVPKRKRRLLSDFFNTVLDVRWRWHIIIFMLTFLISWILFATVWYFIAYVHDDLKFKNENGQNQPILELNKHDSNHSHHNDILHKHHYANKNNDDNENEKNKKPHVPCVHGIHDFTSALLYSVETQHTIGYGLRHITEECPLAILFLMLQSCFGIFVQGLVAGVVFAKISRPNKRKRTIIFSHNAVVRERDGKLCFMFKIGNVRISQLSDAKLKMLMIKSRVTKEGEFIPFQTFNMKVGYDWSGNDSIFFPWPKTVEHVIDEQSPFYEICKQVIGKSSQSSASCSYKTPANAMTEIINNEERNEQENNNNNTTSSSTYSSSLDTECFLLNDPFIGTTTTSQTAPVVENPFKNFDYEIVVMLEGNIETTGASCHIRTSYLPQEILFGYRFVPNYPKFNKFEYLFDFSKFDQVEPFQPHLFHLNVNHLGEKFRNVYDAKREHKNDEQTYQNTIVNEDKRFKFNHLIRTSYIKKPVSLNQVLSEFKAHEKDNVDSQKQTTTTTAAATANSSPPRNSNNAKSPVNVKNSKNGRFTVIPVRPEQHSELHLINDNSPKSMAAKRRRYDSNNLTKQVLLQSKQLNLNSNMANSRRQHNRANSVPPVISELVPLDKQQRRQSQQQHQQHRLRGMVKYDSNVVNHNRNYSYCVDDEGYSTSSKVNTKEEIHNLV